MFKWVRDFRTTRYHKIYGETFACITRLLSRIINKKSVVLFSVKVSALAKDCIDSLDDFFIALRNIVLPIRQWLFKQENSFSDELNLKCQKESIRKRLSFLTKTLIDGFNYDEVNFSQESLTYAQIIVSNVT